MCVPPSLFKFFHPNIHTNSNNNNNNSFLQHWLHPNIGTSSSFSNVSSVVSRSARSCAISALILATVSWRNPSQKRGASAIFNFDGTKKKKKKKIYIYIYPTKRESRKNNPFHKYRLREDMWSFPARVNAGTDLYDKKGVVSMDFYQNCCLRLWPPSFAEVLLPCLHGLSFQLRSPVLADTIEPWELLESWEPCWGWLAWVLSIAGNSYKIIFKFL